MFNFDVNALVEKLEPAVEQVASALGTGAENLWTIGRVGQLAEGIAGMTICVILTILLVLVWKAVLKSEPMDSGDSAEVAMVFGIISLIIGVGISMGVYSAVMHLVAPDWMLLQEIKSVVEAAASK